VSMHGARRFIADLLRGRRPRAFPANSTDTADLRMAIMLRGAAPGADVPADAFVESLHQRLKAELSEEDTPSRRSPRRTRRRQVMRIASVAATSAAIGAAADRVLTGDTPQETVGAQQTLNPNTGSWRTVVASADLPEGGVASFDLDTVTGFVRRTNGTPMAVSGVCTHLGCRLALDVPNRRLNCPCHRTAFAFNGQVLYHQLPIDLPPLPQILVREEGGAVQVYIPAIGS
jgi:cytochrome b6-f complex iron-sulfur subunit